MEREVVHKGTGEVRRTVSYALTSLGPEVADARRLGELLLSRWEVENRSFWVGDVLFREDACQVRGVGAQVLAALRAFLVSLLHRQGVREEEAALEAFFFNPLAALRFLGLYAVWRSSLATPGAGAPGEPPCPPGRPPPGPPGGPGG